MGRSMHDTASVQNKSLHQTLKNITPEKAFTEVKPEIEHFRIFGCPVYFSCTLEEETVFQRSRESQMEIDSETMPSLPSIVQREIEIIPADLVAPVDMFRDIVVWDKRPA
jgi:hypothetical protein